MNYVKDHLTHYLVHECEQPIEVIDKLEPDVRAIAVDISEYEAVKVTTDMLLRLGITNMTLQLLKLVLLAAVLTPSSNENLVKSMDTLGPRVAKPVQRCIEELTGFQLSPSSETTHLPTKLVADGDASTHSTSKYDDLSAEEQLIEATAASKHLREQNAALTLDLSALRDELAQLKLNAQYAPPSSEPTATTSSREMRDEQSDMISALEEELFHSRAQVSAQTKQLASLASIQASRDRLESERDLLHQERDQLQQKSNAADNLKKKVKALQEAQHATDLLQHVYDDSQQELNELRPLRDQCTDLEQRLKDLTEYVDSIEQETSGERHAREEAEHELSFLNQSLLESRAQNQRDQEVLGEYQGRLQELETTREDLSFATLDQELSFSSPLQSPTISQHAPSTPARPGTGDELGRSANSEVLSPTSCPPAIPALPRSVTSIAASTSPPRPNERMAPRRVPSYTITLRARVRRMPAAPVAAARPRLVQTTSTYTSIITIPKLILPFWLPSLPFHAVR